MEATDMLIQAPAAWDYTPRRPLARPYIDVCIGDDPTWVGLPELASDVFRSFGLMILPPRPLTRAAVLDEDGVVLFGYSTDALVTASLGSPAWFGCDFGFWLMGALELADPIDLAIWESAARTTLEMGRKWWDG